MKRTTVIETTKQIGKAVRLCGWVNTIRSHGKILFIDLRDRSGICQIVFTPENKELYKTAQKLKPEWVIEVVGKVGKRPKGMENPKIPTGGIEVVAEELKVLSESETPPFDITADSKKINEELRMKYRYLDLRTERMKNNIILRHKVVKFIRDFMTERDFIEIETPLLTKSTPEGARDFVVPSRLQPGKFYALPQSPQQFKQLLMVAGFEKYFQIARCLRDEDPRADRQAEHTQLDIEMSFVEQEDILNLVEELYIKLCQELFPEKKIQKTPFPRITYKEAMAKYKSDKPDLRKNKKDNSELAFCFITDFPMFEWHKEEKRWGAMHHPFTKPKTEDIKEIRKEPEKILSFQHDFVLNGYEIGGGSIRTTNLDILTAIFEVLGHSPKETRQKFSNYFEAFKYGVPPHGGIAPGIDRFVAVVLGEPNIREVMAFPKTGDNRDLMMEAPSEISKEQLKELHLMFNFGKNEQK